MDTLRSLVSTNKNELNALAEQRMESIALRSSTIPATQVAVGSLGEKLPSDTYAGDSRLRTLRTLLSRVDANGFQRSRHQIQFHGAFFRACCRVLYREDFAVKKASILEKNEWVSAPSEVLISTPRRFGKTFR